MDHVVHHKTNPIVENRTDPDLVPYHRRDDHRPGSDPQRDRLNNQTALGLYLIPGRLGHADLHRHCQPGLLRTAGKIDLGWIIFHTDRCYLHFLPTLTM